MHIVVAVKQVLDPDGVNSYALWGRLAVDDSGRVAVSSATTGTVRLFSREGVELARRDGLATPSALAFGPGGELYVAEAGQRHLRRLVLSAATKP